MKYSKILLLISFIILTSIISCSSNNDEYENEWKNNTANTCINEIWFFKNHDANLCFAILTTSYSITNVPCENVEHLLVNKKQKNKIVSFDYFNHAHTQNTGGL